MPHNVITNEINRFIYTKEVVEGKYFDNNEGNQSVILRISILKQQDHFCYTSLNENVISTDKILIVKPDQLDRMMAYGLMGIIVTNEREVFIVEYIFSKDFDKEIVLNMI